MDHLFFELIRISIGKQNHFPKGLPIEEWEGLYDLSVKHSISGICFAGIRKLNLNSQITPEGIYLDWLDTAVQIQQQNELMNKCCVKAEEVISKARFKTCILKGQGIAQNYGEELANLRESGDIDIWVDGGMQKAMSWARKRFGNVEYDYINAHLPMFNETEVELHWRVSYKTNLFTNKKLQLWIENHQEELLNTVVELPKGVSAIHIPSLRFNRFYILLHCYNHMFSEGLGLRQIMDYFFVLRKEKMNQEERYSLQNDIKRFGLEKFAKAMMWILEFVFGLEKEYMICEPDEKEGRYILNEVMQNGNMGHHDKRIKRIFNSPKYNSIAASIQHSSHLLAHYPGEFFWQPIWIVWHFAWKRTKGRINC